MLLLDEVVSYDDDCAVAKVRIHPASRFYDAELGGVPAWVGIEYMAQTMGIWSGWQHLKKGEPIKLGFLLGSRAYKTEHAVFASGSELLVTAKVVYHEPGGIGAFECRISAPGLDINAQINAFMPDDPIAYARGISGQ